MRGFVLGGLGALFGIVGLAALIGATIGLSNELIHWLESGDWGAGKTVAEAWPQLAKTVAAMNWPGVKHISLWVVTHSLTLFYAALAVVCLPVWFLLLKLSDRSQLRRTNGVVEKKQS
jgi:hypothetical protein